MTCTAVVSDEVPPARPAARERTRALAGAAMLAALLACQPALAQTLSIQPTMMGGVNNLGNSNGNAAGANMVTGLTDGKLYNSYAVFYIPPGEYEKASLSFTSFAPEGSLFPESRIGIFDVSTYYMQFADTFHPGVEAYADLGSGIQYGSALLGSGAAEVTLSGGALYDINATAGRYFMLGFTSFTANALGLGAEGEQLTFINGVGRPPPPFYLQLDIAAPVPEPSAWAMGGAGLLLLGLRARRRQARTPAMS